MIAAVLLGRGVLPPGDFALAPVLPSSLLVHFTLWIAYGLLIGWMVHRLATPWALAAGTAFGLFGMYVVNFHLIAPITFPWFLEARHWVAVLGHALWRGSRRHLRSDAQAAHRPGGGAGQRGLSGAVPVASPAPAGRPRPASMAAPIASHAPHTAHRTPHTAHPHTAHRARRIDARCRRSAQSVPSGD